MTPIEKILAELLEGIRPLLGSRVPTPNLLEEALSSIMMENRIKKLLGGKQQSARPGKVPRGSSGKRSLLPCRLDCALSPSRRWPWR